MMMMMRKATTIDSKGTQFATRSLRQMTGSPSDYGHITEVLLASVYCQFLGQTKLKARCQRPVGKEVLSALEVEDICDSAEQGCQRWPEMEVKNMEGPPSL